MSKKDNTKKKLNDDKKIDDKALNGKKEEQSKGEILFTRIIVGLGILIIVVIILFNIPYSGEKGRIAKKYTSLTNDNVFVYIDYDEIIEKTKKGEEFELLLINTELQDANYYIYCVDLIVKDYKKANIEICDDVYLFNTYDIETSQARYFKDMEKNILKQPALIHFEPTISTESVDYDCTVRYSLDLYQGNYFNMLTKYFANNYKDITED